MREAGQEEVEEYITRRQNTVAQYIVTRPIMDLCEEALWRPGTLIYKQWWDQEGLDLAREWTATAERTEGRR